MKNITSFRCFNIIAEGEFLQDPLFGALQFF